MNFDDDHSEPIFNQHILSLRLDRREKGCKRNGGESETFGDIEKEKMYVCLSVPLVTPIETQTWTRTRTSIMQRAYAWPLSRQEWESTQ